MAGYLLQKSTQSFRNRLLNLVQARYLSLSYNLHKPFEDVPIHNDPIIIMHGLFGSKQNNRSISKVLARDLKTHVYAVDLRNHGESPHDPLHDYAAMAADVEEFIDQHSLLNPVLIGHSMGAKVAMTMALRQPRSIGAVVSVDNAPTDALLKSDFAKYIQGMRKIIEVGVTKQTDADSILKDYEKSLAIRQFLMTNLIRDHQTNTLTFRIPIHTLGSSLDRMGDFPFKDPDQARYDGPALFVRGTMSHYIPDEVLPLIGRFFPLFEVRDIVCGHWVISEQPEAFREAIVEFLRGDE